MNQGMIRRRSALAVTAVLLLGAASPARLTAQSGGTISGAVLDQLAKAIPGAKVTAKSEAGAVSGSATTDGDGRFTIGGLAAGTYSVETTAPGFALNTRRGVQISAGGTQDVSITLNVDAISQSVTVQEADTLAAVDLAPMGNTLDATSAKTEISSAVIHELHGARWRISPR